MKRPGNPPRSCTATNRHRKRNMKHLRTTTALVATILLFCAGCGSTRSVVLHRLPVEHAAPVAAPVRHAMPVAAPVAGESALHKQYLAAICQAGAEYEQAADAGYRANRAEKVIHLTGEALQLGGWKPAELIQIQNQRMAMLKARDFDLAREFSNRARPYIQDRQDYDKAIQSLDEMMRLCQRCAAAPYWNETEKQQWLEQGRLLQDLRTSFVAQFAEATGAVQKALLQAQRQFVNSQAAEDLRAVRALVDGQDNKWFNWRVLGHFRDEVREFAKATRLCDRVLSDPLIDEPTHLAAAAQRALSTRRLGSEGREIYNSCSRLPGYSDSPGFPNPSPGEIHRQSEILWRGNAPQQTLPADMRGDFSSR